MLRDYGSGDAGESAAVGGVTPILRTPRSQDFDGHLSADTHVRGAVDAGQAKGVETSGSRMPDPHTPSGGDVGTAEAAHPIVPAPLLPQPSNTRRSRKRNGVGDAGHRPIDTHGSSAGVASSSSRRESGASSAIVGELPSVGLPDLQSLKFGGDADEGPAERASAPSEPAPGSQTNARRKASEARQADLGETSVHPVPAAQIPPAGNSGSRVDRSIRDAHTSGVDPALIEEIRLQWRMRQLWLRSEVALTLQAKAFCRRLAVEGDKKEADVIYKAALGTGEHAMSQIAMAAMLPLIEARDVIEKKSSEIEKALAKLAKRLPVAPFVIGTFGASLKGLAAIVGEAGDLSMYGNPGKLWKRMGLAPHQGKAYSTWRSDGGLTAADWTEAGYAPKRRSVMFVIGGSLIGGMGKGKRPLVGQDLAETEWSPLERMFVERLRHEAARDPAMGLPPTDAGKESYTRHAAARAQRYVEKRFLRDLWRAWRGEAATAAMAPVGPMPSLSQIAEAAE